MMRNFCNFVVFLFTKKNSGVFQPGLKYAAIFQEHICLDNKSKNTM